MVLEFPILATAFGGSVAAAFYDLKTTEVPDWVFYIMLGFAIPLVILESIFSGGFSTFALAGISGLGLLGFGYLMYKLGQWGGADAVLLAIIGFLIPSIPPLFSIELLFPFPVSFLFNVFIIGTVYMLIYAIFVAIRDKKILHKFMKDTKASAKLMITLALILFFVFIAIMFSLSSMFGVQLAISEIIRGAFLPLALTIAFFIVYKFAKAVENFGFKKKIPVSQLKIGDMILETRELVGIDEKQWKKIKNSRKKFVWIKEGVRFVPAIPLALLFTLFYGDAILLITFLF